MYTANTMSSFIECLGLALPYSSSIPATDPLKIDECIRAGEQIKKLLEMDLKPHDIVTKQSFINAIKLTIIIGGSTNIVLHSIAMARAFSIDISLKDWEEISSTTPVLCDFRPSGKYVMEDLHKIGGLPSLLKTLISDGIIDGDQLIITGKTLSEDLDNIKKLPEYGQGEGKQDIVRPLNNPIKQTGHIRILRGNLAPEGSVAKISKEAICYKKRRILAYMSCIFVILFMHRRRIKKPLTRSSCSKYKPTKIFATESDFKWRHFSGIIIIGCVRWYCKYGISYRDLEEMMQERSVEAVTRDSQWKSV